MVQSPLQVVQNILRTARAKPGENFLFDVRFEVSVGVFQIPDIRWRGDKNPALPRRDASGPKQAFGKEMTFFVVAVPIVVLQQSNASFRRLALRRQVGIVCVFSHVHQPVFINGRGHRIENQRFISDEFDRESCDHLQAAECFGWFLGREWFQHFLEGIALQLAIRDLVSREGHEVVETQERKQRC